MPDPVTAALRFGFEILLLFGGIAVLFVVVARYYGLTSTFTYSVERSRVGWSYFPCSSPRLSRSPSSRTCRDFPGGAVTSSRGRSAS